MLPDCNSQFIVELNLKNERSGIIEYEACRHSEVPIQSLVAMSTTLRYVAIATVLRSAKMKFKLTAIVLFLVSNAIGYAEDIFKSVKNEENQRWAIFEDNGKSAWLYLTEPGIQKPSADAFVYSRVTPITKEKAKEMMEQGNTPIIVDSYSNKLTVRKDIKEKDIVLKWSQNGKAVVVLVGDKPVTLLVVGDKQGFSKGLSKKGFFGKPWSNSTYLKFFGGKDD